MRFHRYNAFVPILSRWNKAEPEDKQWWECASPEQKELIVRRLNGKTGGRWPFPVPPVRVFEKKRKRAQRRLRLALPVDRRLGRQERDDRTLFVEHYRRVGWFQEWSAGVNLPPDIRRCAYEKCSRFFLVSARAEKKYCRLVPCGRNDRVLEFCNARNRGVRKDDLKRVLAAEKLFRGLPDWKVRVALKARVKQNFITYCVRLGKIPRPRE